MTIEINLLAWREARREQRSKRFQLILGVSALAGIAAGWLVSSFYQHQLDVQQQRNQYVEAQSQQLDRDITTLREFREAREQMLTQIELIRELQFSRPQTVRVFNQLVTSLEDGVYYTRLSREGERLRLAGLAETNRQVSDQMRALAAREALGVPTLAEIETNDAGLRRFDMTVAEVPGEPALALEAKP
ncbi:PilN domain-containing protein [Halomonas sp. HP20-15]|uniref:PilN domain-containing protein n=1 Tax=Halomonas sp. HP20-15 TaxID=3085901 RepID=UPI002982572E|nr:PilN domain-containing protein [Halomonas sp. HP20-15]MDW5377335.1 PilN domain-containing protein [Halomonas sp. HP20-15]